MPDSDTPGPMDMDHLEVRVNSFGEFVGESSADLAAAVDGRDGDAGSDTANLTFESPERLFEMFTPLAVRLIGVLAEDDPPNAERVAEWCDADRSDVFDTLERLSGVGVVVGFSQRDPRETPRLAYETIDIRATVPADGGPYS